MRSAFIAVVVALLMSRAWPAGAQDPPPPIGPFVIDLHGLLPRFPDTLAQLAASRGLQTTELPGGGLGADVGVHVYLFKWRAVTVGLGGQAAFARARKSSVETGNGALPTRAVTERFRTISPQLSLNFGHGRGWSYLSGGIGPSNWSLHPDAVPAGPADEERLRTINYGGGARWFVKRHLAFSFDMRFYAIDPGTPVPPSPGSPRTTLMMIGAGVSIK